MLPAAEGAPSTGRVTANKIRTNHVRAPCIGSLPIIGALQVKLGFSGPAFSVFGTDYETPDGTAIRDYVHVTDLADAPARAVDHLSEGGESVALKLGTG